jgi:hypothetical protein
MWVWDPTISELWRYSDRFERWVDEKISSIECFDKLDFGNNQTSNCCWNNSQPWYLRTNLNCVTSRRKLPLWEYQRSFLTLAHSAANEITISNSSQFCYPQMNLNHVISVSLECQHFLLILSFVVNTQLKTTFQSFLPRLRFQIHGDVAKTPGINWTTTLRHNVFDCPCFPYLPPNQTLTFTSPRSRYSPVNLNQVIIRKGVGAVDDVNVSFWLSLWL